MTGEELEPGSGQARCLCTFACPSRANATHVQPGLAAAVIVVVIWAIIPVVSIPTVATTPSNPAKQTIAIASFMAAPVIPVASASTLVTLTATVIEVTTPACAHLVRVQTTPVGQILPRNVARHTLVPVEYLLVSPSLAFLLVRIARIRVIASPPATVVAADAIVTFPTFPLGAFPRFFIASLAPIAPK
jgi:hypothetical protein